MAVKKRAYRQVRRDPNTSILSVVFIDADTGQVVTNLDGYEIIDQGASNVTPTPTTPTDNTDTNASNGNNNSSYNAAEPFNWDEFQNRPGASKGSGDILKDLQKVFGGGVLGLPGIKEAVDGGKRSLAQWIAQTTGIDTLAADELNKEPVKSSGPNGVDEGNMNNVPPIDYTTPIADPESPGAKQLDELMGTPRAAADPITNAPTGEVARNVSYDPKNIGIREYPVNHTVLTDLAAAINATDPTVNAVINSGGQEPKYITDDSGKKVLNPAAKPGVNRVGNETVNHDITVNGTSMALDSKFYRNGTQITPDTDPKFFQQLAKNAVVAGFTQVGMEGNVVHLGKDPKDTIVRTWGYPGSLPEVIAQGVKAGEQLKAADQANGSPLYTKMVADVAANDPLAPRPADRTTPLTNRISALTGSKLDNNKTLQALKDVEKAIGVPLNINATARQAMNMLAGGLDAASSAVSGLGNVMADLTPDNLAVPPELLDAANKIPSMAFADKANGFGADLINAPGNAMRDAIIGQIQPEIGPRMADVARGATAGLQSVAESGSTLNEQVGKGFMQLISSLIPKPEAPPVTGSQTAKTFALNTGAKAADKGGGAEFVDNAIPAPFSLDDTKRQQAVVNTILGEARGEGFDGMAAVANVIKNRALSGEFPMDPMDVVLEQKVPGIYQFAGAKYESDPTSEEYKNALKIAELVFNGQLPDNTGGSTYFHTTDIKPSWADEVTNPKYGTMPIGNHVFYPQKKLSEGLGKPAVTADQASGGPISKGFITPTVPLTESQKTLGADSALGGIPKNDGISRAQQTNSLLKESDTWNVPKDGEVVSGGFYPGFAPNTADKNNNNAGSSYNSDVVSATKKTTADQSSGTSVGGAAASGSKSTGAATGFMSKTVTTVPKTTSSQAPSPITKSIVSGGAKSTGTAATKVSTPTTTAKPMNKGML